MARSWVWKPRNEAKRNNPALGTQEPGSILLEKRGILGRWSDIAEGMEPGGLRGGGDTWPSGNCSLASGSGIGVSDSGSGCTAWRSKAAGTFPALGRTDLAAG